MQPNLCGRTVYDSLPVRYSTFIDYELYLYGVITTQIHFIRSTVLAQWNNFVKTLDLLLIPCTPGIEYQGTNNSAQSSTGFLSVTSVCSVVKHGSDSKTLTSRICANSGFYPISMFKIFTHYQDYDIMNPPQSFLWGPHAPNPLHTFHCIRAVERF
jgi:hypothetical protein